MADSIAIWAPMVAPSLELPWEEEEASEESRVSDGLAENSSVVVAEETTVMRGNAKLDVGNAVISAEVVVLDEDIGITRCWGQFSNAYNTVPQSRTARSRRRQNL